MSYTLGSCDGLTCGFPGMCALVFISLRAEEPPGHKGGLHAYSNLLLASSRPWGNTDVGVPLYQTHSTVRQCSKKIVWHHILRPMPDRHRCVQVEARGLVNGSVFGANTAANRKPGEMYYDGWSAMSKVCEKNK